MSSGNLDSRGTVVYTRCPVGNATEIALSLGWLREEFRQLGYEFKSISDADPKHWLAHFNHDHPALFRDGGNIPPIWARSDGADTKLIGLSFLNGTQAIVVKPESGINSVNELKGKRIALPVRPHEPIDFWRATTKRGFEAALAANGLEIDDVELVHISNKRPYFDPSPINDSLFGPDPGRRFQQLEIEALAIGHVDAIYLSGGRAAEVERTGAGRIVFDLAKAPDLLTRTNIVYPNVITVSGRLAKKRPELVVAYLRVLIEAADWAGNSRESVLRLFADATFVEPRDFEAAWPTDFHRNLEPGLSESGLAALEVEKDFLLRERFIERDFDVADWVDSAFLEEALSQVKGKVVGSGGGARK